MIFNYGGPTVSDRFPVVDGAAAEAEARDLGYPSHDMIPCPCCDGTAYCWHRYDPKTQCREPCIRCGARGWVPRVFPCAFLGRSVSYAEFCAIR